jgi:hypothetical protein
VSVAAGIPTRIVPHQLRHTYATEMFRSGVSFPALMKLLGHTSRIEKTGQVGQAGQEEKCEKGLSNRGAPEKMACHRRGNPSV